MEQLEKKIINDILDIVCKNELSRNEFIKIFNFAINVYDDVAIITNKRKCSRNGREQNLFLNSGYPSALRQ